MVGPARKREAVVHVQSSLGTSERRACLSLGQPRSTQRYHGFVSFGVRDFVPGQKRKCRMQLPY